MPRYTPHDDETKRKIAEANKGKVVSEETRRKISEAKKGKPVGHSEERIRKLVENNKRRGELARGKPGRPHTEESKRKIGDAHRGKVAGSHSEEHKRKISESLKGREISQETIEKRRKALTGHAVSEETRRKIGQANKGREQTEEANQKRREASQKRANDPEYLAKVSAGVKKAYENPEFRERNRQILDEIRAKALTKTTGVPLTEERKAQIALVARAQKLEYWAGKSEEERSAHMRKATEASMLIEISSLEIKVKAILDGLEVAYKQQYRIWKYYTDFYVESENLVIEVNGCFWHSCQQCGYSYEAKQLSDAKREKFLRGRGYKIVTIWEHDIKNGQAALLLEEVFSPQ